MQAQAQTFTPEALKGKPDGELARLYADAGSEAAFAELARRYARLVYSTCLRETQDRTLAEDATQGVFLLLSQKAGALKRCETLAGWLFTAARYVARNLMKQERRRQMKELQAARETPPQNGGNASWETIEPRLNDALEHLKPADREAILLRFMQEKSLAEVGACFGVSENTARMRVARALEKMRLHLAKAGIAVTVGALTLLLDKQSAQAIPAGVYEMAARVGVYNATPSASNVVTNIARQAARQPARKLIARLLIGTVTGLLLLGGAANYYIFSRQSVIQTEQRRLFSTLAGTWRGSLEYADDKTQVHSTYPTSVVIRSQNQGDRLELTATYTGTSNVDVTTFTRNPNTGRFAIENGGPQSSHNLGGDGVLTRLPDGEFAFQGTDVAHDREVRLRISLQPGKLTLQEEYRTDRSAKYEFRNRFTLTK